jgi:hypothetical protein
MLKIVIYNMREFELRNKITSDFFLPSLIWTYAYLNTVSRICDGNKVELIIFLCNMTIYFLSHYFSSTLI